MHRAAGQNAKSVVRLLLDRGGDVTAVDKDDRTPLHMAARSKVSAGSWSGAPVIKGYAGVFEHGGATACVPVGMFSLVSGQPAAP